MPPRNLIKFKMQAASLFVFLLMFVLVVSQECDNPYGMGGANFQLHENCSIKSGEYKLKNDSDIIDVINGGKTHIKLTVTAVKNSESIVAPILQKLIGGAVGVIPEVGAMVAALFDIMFTVLGRSDTNPYNKVIAQVMQTMDDEITAVYNYVDHKISKVLLNNMKVSVQNIANRNKLCRFLADESDATEEDKLDCYKVGASICHLSYPKFSTKDVDYEEAFPVMITFGSMCLPIMMEVVSFYTRENDTVDRNQYARQIENLLSDFIHLYDSKLEVIVDKHTSMKHLHSDINCTLTRYKLASDSVPYVAYRTSCTERFGHRTVAQRDEIQSCTLSHVLGCKAWHTRVNDYAIFKGCSTASHWTTCREISSTQMVLDGLKSRYKSFAQKREIYLRKYWQNAAGVVVDKWRKHLSDIQTVLNPPTSPPITSPTSENTTPTSGSPSSRRTPTPSSSPPTANPNKKKPGHWRPGQCNSRRDCGNGLTSMEP